MSAVDNPGAASAARSFEFRSSDLDEIPDFIGERLTSHTLAVTRREAPLNTVPRHAPMGDTSIKHLRYGAVEIRQTQEENVFLLIRPLDGRADFHNGRNEGIADAQTGLILAMDQPNHIRSMTADHRSIVVRIERESIQRHLAHCLGRDLTEPLEFKFIMPLDSGPGAAFWRYIEFLNGEIERGSELVSSPLAVTHIRQLLMTALLTLQPHNYSEALERVASPAAPFYVRRAEEYIASNAGKPVTIDDLVAATGVSARSLYDGFRRFRGSTPMRYLKEVRLRRAREDLLAADPATETVTDIALGWGFFHLGKFAADYRRRFGEKPSATLRHAGVIGRFQPPPP